LPFSRAFTRARVGDARQTIAVRDEELVGGRRVEDVLAELLGEAGELDPQRLQPFLGFGRQVCAGPLELPDRLLEMASPDAREARGFRRRGAGLHPQPQRLVER
jgi:hypothetical protein